ncbi:MAG: tRNA lysidine(34) synthetase TilS [Oscillospiraceae bacterium]|nr:tRNA lysidine(34) synthetase TilS [Oscillospiraceae bacterium]
MTDLNFEDNVKFAAEKHCMLKNVNTVYVGLSGGADSVSLLLALNSLKGEYGFKLEAVHINHSLRGKESDRDQLFCENLCSRLNIPCKVYTVDAAAYAKAQGVSVEEGARNLRYEIFSRLDGKIATAHTLNDSAETVIFNLARGTGIKGLAGIPPVRDKIIRPLIYCTREEVESYLEQLGQDFVTDSTNLTDDYSRNKIRHRIIPLMEELHGGFTGNIRRMTENLAADSDYLETEAEKAENDDLRQLHPAIRRRVIIRILKGNSVEVNGERVAAIEEAVLKNGGKINLSEDVYAAAKDGRLEIKRLSGCRIKFEDTPLQIGENPFLCDKTVIISQNNCEKGQKFHNINKIFTNECFDCDKIQGDIVLRNRRDGDGYVRANRAFTSSLKKLMNEKYPAEIRDFVPVIADEKGIIWVQGFGIADRVKIDENTVRYFEVSVK